MTPCVFYLSHVLAPDAAVPAFVDRQTLSGAVLIGLVPLVLAAALVAGKWWRSRDEIFTGVTPGLLAADPGSAPRRRVRSGEWNGTVAVSFIPPKGVTPGVAGTVIDGVADRHDASATIVDLAVRGWLRIEEVPGPAGSKADDWMLHRNANDPREAPTGFERTLIDNLFAAGHDVRLSELKGSFGMAMREAQIGLYREVVDRGWYRRHPRAKNARARLWGLLVMVPLTLIATALVLRAGLVEHDWSLVPLAVGGLFTVAVLARWGRARTPRTAEGTAVRIETLGFKHYLETAEADQIRFEEADDTFSRYLPYAMAFGIAEIWARLFAEVATRAQLAGWTDPFWDLAWFDALDLAAHSAELLGGVADLADVASLVDVGGDLASGRGDAVEGVAGTVGGLGDFTDAASGLLDVSGLLDGCDGCDGCDF